MFNKKSFFISMLLLIFLTIGMVSASDNLTDEVSLDDASAQSIETPISSEIERIHKLHHGCICNRINLCNLPRNKISWYPRMFSVKRTSYIHVFL